MNANELMLHNLQEREFTRNGLLYVIKANKKIVNFKRLKKIHFFNRKRLVSEAIYYQNGTLYQKHFKVDFEKAYFFEGDFYMQNCYATLQDGYIKSDFAIYKQNYVEFQKLVMKKENKIYHKFKYITYLK